MFAVLAVLALAARGVWAHPDQTYRLLSRARRALGWPPRG
jgi:hypothetical protein